MLRSHLFLIIKNTLDMMFGTLEGGHALMWHIASATYVALAICRAHHMAHPQWLDWLGDWL